MLTWAPGSIFTVINLVLSLVGSWEPGTKGYLAIRCTFCKQGTFKPGCGFYAVGKDHIDAVLGVPEGGLPVMGMARMAGGHNMGRAAGEAVGLAMAGAEVAQLPVGGTVCVASMVSAV